MKLYHLFPDLMNLYGEYGNLRILQQYLGRREVEARIVPLRPGEPLDLDQAGFVYMGAGAEPARDAALEHLRALVPALREGLDSGLPMLFTGNAWLTLGRGLVTAEGKELEGLGLFDFTAVESWDRYTGDAVARPAQGEGRAVVGLQNRCDQVRGVQTPWFQMEMGAGNAPDSPLEGLRAGSCFATHLIGPLLVKNPHILVQMGALLGAEPGPQGDPDEAELAYDVTLAALKERM